MFCRIYTMLIVLWHPRERLFFHFFQNAFRLAGRFEKMKKSRERVCNSTISMGEGGKKHLFFNSFLISLSFFVWLGYPLRRQQASHRCSKSSGCRSWKTQEKGGGRWYKKYIIQGATKKHARLRPFPFLCEILIQFHEKIIKFDQIFVKQKIRV